MATAKNLCSKCGVNPRMNPEGTNPWCHDCHAEYQAAWNRGRLERACANAYAMGVEAMRAACVARFSVFLTAYFSGAEIAAKIQQIYPPPAPPKPAEAPSAEVAKRT